MLKVKVEPSLRIGRDTLYPVPPELIGLLRSLQQHGSLIHAIKDVGISYRHAWALLGRWEAITGHKLAILTRGQGTGLTPFGTRLAGLGEWMESRISKRIDGLAEELARHLDMPADAGTQRALIHASHDLALLKLKERLDRQLSIDLRFEGSLHSLDSLHRGDCDIAGFHLPHPVALLGRLVQEFAARLNTREHYVVWLLSRYQGLILPRSLGARVRSLRDIARRKLRFINRERGSGTRLLLDALLLQEGIPASALHGYDNEEFTHMATAATVRAGMADVAFGIEAAARAHDLAFVRLVTEHYYLACRRNTPSRIAVDTMATAAQSSAFSRAITRIGGYDNKGAGGQVRLADLFGRAAAD